MKDEPRFRLCPKRWYRFPDDKRTCPKGGEDVRMHTILVQHRQARTFEARLAYAWLGRNWLWDIPFDRNTRIVYFKPTVPFFTDTKYESVPLSEVQEHFARSRYPQ